MRDVGAHRRGGRARRRTRVDFASTLAAALPGLYFSLDQDDLVARRCWTSRGSMLPAPLVNEGGAIHVDGQGTALVTEEC